MKSSRFLIWTSNTISYHKKYTLFYQISFVMALQHALSQIPTYSPFNVVYPSYKDLGQQRFRSAQFQQPPCHQYQTFIIPSYKTVPSLARPQIHCIYSSHLYYFQFGMSATQIVQLSAVTTRFISKCIMYTSQMFQLVFAK